MGGAGGIAAAANCGFSVHAGRGVACYGALGELGIYFSCISPWHCNAWRQVFGPVQLPSICGAGDSRPLGCPVEGDHGNGNVGMTSPKEQAASVCAVLTPRRCCGRGCHTAVTVRIWHILSLDSSCPHTRLGPARATSESLKPNSTYSYNTGIRTQRAGAHSLFTASVQ